MSTKFVSLERLVARVGVSTAVVDGKFVVCKQADIDEGYDHVAGLSYDGKAALFGEDDTAFRGYAYCIENYFSPMTKSRVLVIKGDECDDDDLSFADNEAYLERSVELTVPEMRPPVCFSVDLRSLRTTLQNSPSWPKARVEASPTGEYCFLLVCPSARDTKAAKEAYLKGCKALKDFDAESYREDRFFAWSARYRGAAEGFCPPIASGDKGYFFTHVRKFLLPALKGAKRTDYELTAPKRAPVEEEVEEVFEDALERPGPVEPGFAGLSVTKDGSVVRDYAPGTDPITKRLADLGYTGKIKSAYYDMIRKGEINVEQVPATHNRDFRRAEKEKSATAAAIAGGGVSTSRAGLGAATGIISGIAIRAPRPLPEQSQGTCSRPLAREYPTSERDNSYLLFPDYPMLEKLNSISRRGDMGKVSNALKTPHPTWVKIQQKITPQVTTMKNWVEKNPRGDLQMLINKANAICPTEMTFIKMLTVMGSLFDLDCYTQTYSQKVAVHALDATDDEEDEF